MSAVYHWLVNSGGLWYAVVAWLVGWLMGLAVAWRPFRKHMSVQHEQVQLLKDIRHHVSR